MREGGNAVGLFLGNGMYNVNGGRYTKFTGSFGPLKAIGQLRLEYADGSTEVIGTDDHWRVAPARSPSPAFMAAKITMRGLNRMVGTSRASTIPSGMRRVVVNGPGGKLKGLSCAAPPIRAFDVLKPVKHQPLRATA